jgi:hypothetical protein
MKFTIKSAFLFSILAMSLMLATQAKADFISLPIRCNYVSGINGSSSEVLDVAIQNLRDGRIVAQVKDHNDQSVMLCQKQAQGVECKGFWENDKSPAYLNATTNTFSPFVTLIRSQALYRGLKLVGVCINK